MFDNWCEKCGAELRDFPLGYVIRLYYSTNALAEGLIATNIKKELV